MSADAVITVEGLAKDYGHLRAVDGIDFRVLRGKVFSFLGPNGAGKTTTVEILEGLRRATSGHLSVLGLDPWKHASELHRKVGVMPQGFRFFDKVTPREAVRYYARLFGVRTDPDALLRRVLLSDKADDTYDKLSGGQKQKLGVALAMVNDPELLFLDEPTTGLDPQARRAVWELLRELKNEGRTIFLTTHYLEEAEQLADWVAILNHGRIVTEGTPTELIEKHGEGPRLVLQASPELVSLLSQQARLGLTIRDGTIQIPIHQKAVLLDALNTVARSGLPWPEINTERDTLENVFISMVGEIDESGEVRGA
ncbi:MAG: ABC transporter ATP-binding protein [Euryarchaeota archaeon]|nr:ABC transporter ATP-binding protein [Euryarchaeota archaeon]MDE1835990.1 ABC transporter ATP-binding protein [Euryarchaeota archaeon]MDE1880968.1 ABC transporter ATP-binding protein [Euryarchaeota archaeon]MDE2046018.1 ABC transporter ATP-binding protein [Thermoplasmata archaeon]